MVIHALKNKGEILDLIEPISQRNEDILLGDALLDSINSFSIPGSYNVEDEIEDPTVSHDTQISLKNLMLKAMDRFTPLEQERQQDAAECFSALLGKIPSLSFLWHQLHEQTTCTGCNHVSHSDTRMSIIPVEMSSKMKRKRGGREVFATKDAIKQNFALKEDSIVRDCENCEAKLCSKEISLAFPPDFIIVQFKRFKSVKPSRNRPAEFTKINYEMETFSAIDIETSLGDIKRYEVFATIEHIGDEMQMGHYVSYLADNGIWFKCNDSIVTQLPKEDESPTENMYILLLKKSPE